MDIPLKHCSDPKAWAEKHCDRGTKKLSPLTQVVDKQCGIFRVLSQEAVGMQTQATVAADANKWLNWALLKSCCETRKDPADLQDVVVSVRGLICT